MSRQQRRTTREKTPTATPTTSTWAWVMVAAVVVVDVAIRLRLLAVPLERDEGEYAYAGQLILHGIAPYRLVYNMKLPGIYYAYALVLASFGQNPVSIHVGLMLVNLGALVVLFFIGRRLYGPTVGVVASAAYGFLTINEQVFGVQAHATHFVVLPALAGVLLAMKAAESGKVPTVFWSGVLLGLAFTMKQSGVFFIIFTFVYLWWADRGNPKAQSAAMGHSRVRWLVAFAGGAALPLLILCGVLYVSGVFGTFWFWAVRYAAQYATEVPIEQGLRDGYQNTISMILPSWPFWLVPAVGMVLVWVGEPSRPRAWWITGFVVCGVLTVCPGLYFRPHYYITLMPAVALLEGVAVERGRQLFQRSSAPRALALIPALAFVVVLALTVFVPLAPSATGAHSEFLFEEAPDVASRMLYGINPWPEAARVADYIKQHSATTDTLAVLGSEPEIYFLADRKSATGYIYTYPLMESQKFSSEMQQQMMAEIRKGRPKFIVFVNLDLSWLWTSSADLTIVKWALTDFLPASYHAVGYVPPFAGFGPEPAGAHDVWGAEASLHPIQRPGDGSLYVFERNGP